MYLYISSKARRYGTKSNFICDVVFPKHFKSLRLLEVRVPLTMYVFDSNNNVLQFIEASTPSVIRTATITEGNYTTSGLITEIQNQMNAAGTQSYTANYSSNTLKLTISASSAFQLIFNGNHPGDRLGFPSGVTQSLISHTGSDSINLSPSGDYFLSIDGIGLNSVISPKTQNFSGHYPLILNGVSGEISIWRNFDFHPNIPANTIFGTLVISLRNGNGSFVNINSEWSLIFEVHT